MRDSVEIQRQHLIKTLQRMQRQITTHRGRDSADMYEKEYKKEIEKYENMLQGGDGGNFRNSIFSIRELHFKEWRDSDFQLLLEAIGETYVIDDDEWNYRFGHERGFFKRLFSKGGRPQ